jgi:hypothetical protein
MRSKNVWIAGQIGIETLAETCSPSEAASAVLMPSLPMRNGSSKANPAIALSCTPSDRGTQVQAIIFPRLELIFSNRDRAQKKALCVPETSSGFIALNRQSWRTTGADLLSQLSNILEDVVTWDEV